MLHKEFPNWAKFMDGLLYRSTQILFALEPAQTISSHIPRRARGGHDEFEASPASPHTHTLGVVQDQVFLKIDTGFVLINLLPLRGTCNGREGSARLEFHILEQVPTGEVFAGLPCGTLDSVMLSAVSKDGRDAIF